MTEARKHLIIRAIWVISLIVALICASDLYLNAENDSLGLHFRMNFPFYVYSELSFLNAFTAIINGWIIPACAIMAGSMLIPRLKSEKTAKLVSVLRATALFTGIAGIAITLIYTITDTIPSVASAWILLLSMAIFGLTALVSVLTAVTAVICMKKLSLIAALALTPVIVNIVLFILLFAARSVPTSGFSTM